MTEARLLDLGSRAYREVWELQHRVHDAVREGREPDTWIVVEHRAGRHARAAGEARERLASLTKSSCGAGSISWISSAAATSRTMGPGSSSFIPIRKLDRFREVVPLVRSLEAAVIDVCARFGVRRRTLERTCRRVGRAQPNLRRRPCNTTHGFAARHRAQRLDRARLRSPHHSLRPARSRHHVTLGGGRAGRSSLDEAKPVLFDELAHTFDVQFLARRPIGGRIDGRHRSTW